MGSDRDLKDGFEGAPLTRPLEGFVGSTDRVSAQLSIDAGLFDGLTMTPVTVLIGHEASGRTLFALELARFGLAFVMRTVMNDIHGLSERSGWQMFAGSHDLLRLIWQSASADGNDGYLQVMVGATPLLVNGHSEREPLVSLRTMMERNVTGTTLISIPKKN